MTTTVDVLAEAYHRYRLQFPGGELFCGSESRPFEFGSGPCSCHMDMAGTVQAIVIPEPEPLHTVTDSSGNCTFPCPVCEVESRRQWANL